MADYTKLRTPFASMSFTPDVPSNALGPNEYNSGRNVETDVRGVKKIDGEQKILSLIPHFPIFMEGGFRANNQFVYIVATRDSANAGRWYMLTNNSIVNITPGYAANNNVTIAGYTDAIHITTSWVGEVFFINDSLGSPMYFLPSRTEISRYDTAPDNYLWNYDIGVTNTAAGFMRNFCSPNVGNILIAGNLTKTSGSTVTNFSTTIRWSQAFVGTGVPATWLPSLSNVANEQEVPVRGPLIDGFFLGSNFYVCSYWDTVVLSPIAYQSTTTPVFGVRLFNQGRGLLNNNCWTNTDANVYGVDARDIWVFDGTSFNSLGNQKVKDFFFSSLSSLYSDRVFMVNNTQKYQIEIYYPDTTSTGWCNKMLSYRYDLQIWNAPKDIQNACMGAEGPVFVGNDFKYVSRCVTYAPAGQNNQQLIQTGIGNSFANNAPIPALFERNNVVLQTEKGPVPYSSKVYIHRALPEVAGSGELRITVGGANSTAQSPTYGQTGRMDIVTDNPWVTTQQNAVRTVSLKVESNDATDTWNATAMNWQATIVEDAF
jgi:hypothetical protein